MTMNRHLPIWLCICLLCAAAIVVAQKAKPKKAMVVVPTIPCTIIAYPPLPYDQEKITLTSFDSGKTWTSFGSRCVSELKTYLLVTAPWPRPTKYAHPQATPALAQQKEQKVFRLPLEASKAYADIEAAEKPLIDQLNAHERTKLALQIGAGVALEARGHCVFDKEILVCAAPQASPSPEKK